MQPWQADDFAALDPAWLALAGRSRPRDSPRRVVQRAWIERPRGHSKTLDVAVHVTWVLLHAEHAVNGVVAASDLDQARFVLDAVVRLANANPETCEPLEFRRDAVRNRRTGSVAQLVSSHVNSSFGALPDFVVCDELCHWERPEMWHSLASSAAKKPGSVLVVLTNAGVGRGWQWELRERARTSPDWYFSSLPGTRAPWIEPRWLDEQRALLPPPVFARLWENVWQHSDGGFVTLAEAEACRDASLAERPAGRPGVAYVAAVDYAEKHDHTVGVVAHHDGTRVVVDRMDVVVPTPERPTRVEWVERWIEGTAREFPRVTFVVDPYQLVGTVQRFDALHVVHRFEFAAGRGNHELATTLRRMLLNGEIAWYPGCGAIETPAGGRDDLETELASLLLRQTAGGRVRIDHHRDGVHHDDRAFTLGVACLHLAKEHGATEWLETTAPHDGGFDW